MAIRPLRLPPLTFSLGCRGYRVGAFAHLNTQQQNVIQVIPEGITGLSRANLGVIDWSNGSGNGPSSPSIYVFHLDFGSRTKRIASLQRKTANGVKDLSIVLKGSLADTSWVRGINQNRTGAAPMSPY